jgi:hypothetical protein
VALAPVTQNDITGYACEGAEAMPYAGQLNLTPKASSQDIYYDDDLYARIQRVLGEEVELRLAEMPLKRMAELGMGTYDESTHTLEAAFTPVQREYSLRCVDDTIEGLPLFFKWRVFELSGIRIDNRKTMGDSAAVAEVVITGVFKNPTVPGLMPITIVEMAEDMSNAEAAAAFISAPETYPPVTSE